jgi:hypothetical protein
VKNEFLIRFFLQLTRQNSIQTRVKIKKQKKKYFNKNNGHGLKQLPDKAGPFPGIKGYDFSYILHTICANFLKTIIFFYI